MRTELKERLAALHDELRRTHAVDPQSRELLITLLEDISRLLGKPGALGGPAGALPAGPHSVTERLDELAVQFEAEHPALGVALRQVVDTLAKAGI